MIDLMTAGCIKNITDITAMVHPFRLAIDRMTVGIDQHQKRFACGDPFVFTDDKVGKCAHGVRRDLIGRR